MKLSLKEAFDEAIPSFFHGSTMKLEPGDFILPPAETSKISEKGRKKNLDKVFMTQDMKYAKIYADRAKYSLGGDPYIYQVEPIGDISWLNSNPGQTVILADRARVIRRM